MVSNQQQMHLKLLQRDSPKKQQMQLVILTGNKIPNRITKVSKNSKQSISQTVATKHRKKKKDKKPEERLEIIDELRSKQQSNGISKNHKSFKIFKSGIKRT